MWRSIVPFDDKKKKFRYTTFETPLELAAMEKARSVGVSAISVSASRPQNSIGQQSSSKAWYMHLSSNKHRPSLCLNTPCGAPPPQPHDGFWHNSLNHGKLRTGCFPAPEGGPRKLEHVGGILCEYHPDDAQDKGKQVDGNVTTLALCSGVEATIRDWDADAVKAFVDLMGLHPIGVDGGEPLEPKLQVWQRVWDY